MTHLDLDRLAELEEGLLAPAEEADAQAHLRDCADCRARQAQLAGTRALLSTVPAEPMPSAVAARIDAALAGLPSTTIVPLTGRKRSWRAHPTAAGLGAAAAVAALVAALVVGRTSHPSTSDGAGANTLGAASAPRAEVVLPSSTVSGARYTAGNLTGKVTSLLTPSTALSAETAPSQPSTGVAPQPSASQPVDAAKRLPATLSRLYGSPGALASCVLGLEEQLRIPSAQPLAIDFGKFKTPTGVEPAVVIVLPGFDDPGTLGAWVVGANCTREDADLLNYAAVPAPPSSSASPPATP